jgi:hypothetical protein
VTHILLIIPFYAQQMKKPPEGGFLARAILVDYSFPSTWAGLSLGIVKAIFWAIGSTVLLRVIIWWAIISRWWAIINWSWPVVSISDYCTGYCTHSKWCPSTSMPTAAVAASPTMSTYTRCHAQ